ncbi:heme peroxidase family protein [Microbacterium sp.]|uniref:peroxidase family protein n=1 Tax=Microbacterium sp. TaxID=51671 RepID=UPI00273469F4|nr:heme peroxidase family protein [Microbacterium sp.]MDP3951932.1 heme peroxidase family protein [Microbacterium sp.]
MTEATIPEPQPASPEPSAAAPPADAHGAMPTRGIGNVPRSSIETGKFGRLFRGLPPLALDESQIQNLVNMMVDPGDVGAPGGWSPTPTPSDAGIAAGWTYLAQFIDHDITFDPTSMLDQANDPDALENFRTPRFDLDSVYGLGPTANPWLYDHNDPDMLLLGVNPPEFAQRDLNRNHQGRALIGDPRNDVHVILSQLHLAFVEFHNQVVRKVRQQPDLVTGVPATPIGGWGSSTSASDQPTFGQVVTLVRWHYQWLVLRGFLPAICGPDVVNAVLQVKKGKLDAELKLYNVRRKPWMPAEFSGAAYRFGHSLVRDAYLLNGGLSPLPVFSSAGDGDSHADLRGFRRLPAGWDIEWHRFFDGLPGSGTDTQRARRFDTRIAPGLHNLPASVDAMRRSLALLNIKRGIALELPSGEDFAAAVAGKLRIDTGSVRIETGLPHPAPLWFWLLKEAEVTRDGQSLGPIGGRVVAEVLVGLAQNDPSSFLKAQPDWVPTLGATPGEFTIADLLAIAQVTL